MSYDDDFFPAAVRTSFGRPVSQLKLEAQVEPLPADDDRRVSSSSQPGNSRLDTPDSRRQFVENQLAYYQDRLAEMTRFDEDDPCVDGDVIKFVVQIAGTGARLGQWHDYTYVAVRVDGRFLTSAQQSHRKVLTWNELVKWLTSSRRIRVVAVHRMTTGEKLV